MKININVTVIKESLNTKYLLITKTKMSKGATSYNSTS